VIVHKKECDATSMAPAKKNMITYGKKKLLSLLCSDSRQRSPAGLDVPEHPLFARRELASIALSTNCFQSIRHGEFLGD